MPTGTPVIHPFPAEQVRGPPGLGQAVGLPP
jgi:hypothetical protein